MKTNKRINNSSLTEITSKSNQWWKTNNNFLRIFFANIYEFIFKIDDYYRLNVSTKDFPIEIQTDLNSLTKKITNYLFMDFHSYVSNEFIGPTQIYYWNLSNHSEEEYIDKINQWLSIIAKVKIKFIWNEKDKKRKFKYFLLNNFQKFEKFNFLLNSLNKYGYALDWNNYGECIFYKLENQLILDEIINNSADEEHIDNFYQNVINFYKTENLDKKKLYFESITKSVYNALLKPKEVEKIEIKINSLNNKRIFTQDKINKLSCLINGFRHKYSEDEKNTSKKVSLEIDELYEKDKSYFELLINELMVEFLEIIAIAKLNKIHLEL